VIVVPQSALASSYSCILGMNLLAQQPILLDWQAGQVRPLQPDLVAALTAV
jgi:hypothetical protein